MFRFIDKQENVRYYTDDTKQEWVDIKAELSGHEDRKRDDLFKDYRCRFNDEDIAAIEKHESDAAIEMKIGAIESAIDRFDLSNYVTGWSWHPVANWENIARLDKESYQWLLSVVDVHRRATVLQDDDVKNLLASSRVISPELLQQIRSIEVDRRKKIQEEKKNTPPEEKISPEASGKPTPDGGAL